MLGSGMTMLYNISGRIVGWCLVIVLLAGQVCVTSFLGVCMVLMPHLWSVGLVFCYLFTSTGGPCLWCIGFGWDLMFVFYVYIFVCVSP